MKTLTHIIAVRQRPSPEIREVTVPAEEAADRISKLSRDYETVFVRRRFQVREDGV